MPPPQENLFAIIVCTQLRMPLIIVGPPGSSKTLSFQIVQQAVLRDAVVREQGPRVSDYVPVRWGLALVHTAWCVCVRV